MRQTLNICRDTSTLSYPNFSHVDKCSIIVQEPFPSSSLHLWNYTSLNISKPPPLSCSRWLWSLKVLNKIPHGRIFRGCGGCPPPRCGWTPLRKCRHPQKMLTPPIWPKRVKIPKNTPAAGLLMIYITNDYTLSETRAKSGKIAFFAV